MIDSAEERLRRLLGGAHLASLRKRLRQRFERAPLDAAVESFRIGNLTPEEHAVLASLMGRPQRYSNSLQVDLRLVDTAFQNSGIAASLRDALEQLDGPITHLAAARLQLQSLWLDVIEGCDHPGLIGLLQTSTGIGLLKRLAKQTLSVAIKLCRRAEAVLHRLPANGITRSQLAADVLGDAHALDGGRGTATLVLAVWRQAFPVSHDEDDDSLTELTSGDDAQQSSRVERDRDIWARAGVLVNELARPVLFLNLPTCERQTHRWTRGEPAYASLRLLLRSPPSWHVANRKVYVCENPNLLAIAADRLGSDCAPLVCTDGMPAAAQRCLLSQLANKGARLCYHGDFDWPGVRIGNLVMREHGAQPWQFCAANYKAAVQTASGVEQTLRGNVIHAVWDNALSTVMQEAGIAVAEESLASCLLHDLCKLST